jgi:hypothetical protein
MYQGEPRLRAGFVKLFRRLSARRLAIPKSVGTAGQEEVRRLDVPVHERECVRFGQALANLEHELDGLGRLERTHGRKVGFETDSFEPLHDEVRLARLELSHVVDARDVLPLEERSGARFVHETQHELLVVDEVGANDLERHRSFEPEMSRLEHQSHSALANDAAHAIAPIDDVAGRDGRNTGRRDAFGVVHPRGSKQQASHAAATAGRLPARGPVAIRHGQAQFRRTVRRSPPVFCYSS